MRLKLEPTVRETALASTVLPTPGTSSIKTCPRHNKATRTSSTSCRLPTMTRSTFWMTRSASSWTDDGSMEWRNLSRRAHDEPVEPTQPGFAVGTYFENYPVLDMEVYQLIPLWPLKRSCRSVHPFLYTCPDTSRRRIYGIKFKYSTHNHARRRLWPDLPRLPRNRHVHGHVRG